MEQKPNENQISTIILPHSKFGQFVKYLKLSARNHWIIIQQYLALLTLTKENNRPTIPVKVVECPVVRDLAKYVSKKDTFSAWPRRR